MRYIEKGKIWLWYVYIANNDYKNLIERIFLLVIMKYG